MNLKRTGGRLNSPKWSLSQLFFIDNNDDDNDRQRQTKTETISMTMTICCQWTSRGQGGGKIEQS